MTGPTHLTFAAASSLALVSSFNPVFKWHYIAAVLIGALAPDLDSRRSVIHTPSNLLKYFMPNSLATFCDKFMQSFAWLVRKLIAHRGVLHSPFVVICLLCLAYSLNSGFVFWFAFAYAGHIALDFCTCGGIPYFSPFSKKTYSAFDLRTGSYFEIVFCASLLWYIAFTISRALNLI